MREIFNNDGTVTFVPTNGSAVTVPAAEAAAEATTLQASEPPSYPQQVPMWAVHVIADQLGLTAQVTAYIASLSGAQQTAAQDEWQFAPNLETRGTFATAFLAATNMTQAQWAALVNQAVALVDAS